MATKNDVTGDSIRTKTVSQAYRDNYDRIFRKKKVAKKAKSVKDK
jgi:hypothetical protein